MSTHFVDNIFNWVWAFFFFLYTVKWFQVLLWNSNNLTFKSFVCTHLNGYTYESKVNSLSVISFLNELELICLHTSIVTVSTQLNGFNYCYLPLIILLNINHLFADSEVVASIAI